MRASTSVSQQERRVPTPEQLGVAPRNARFCGMVTYLLMLSVAEF